MDTLTPTKSRSRRDIEGNLLIFSATIFFGINVPVMKILIPDWLSAVQVTACRFIGGASLLWITSMFLRNPQISHGDWKRILPAGILVFFFLFLFSLAFKYANPIDISIIMILPPIIVVVINAFFRHYKVGVLEWVGTGISFAGAAVLILARANGTHGHDNLLGELCALGSSLCYAVYLIFIEEPAKKYPAITLMRWVLGIAAVLCLPFVWGFPHSHLFLHPSAWPIGLICFTVLLATYYSYIVTTPAIKMIGSEMVSMYQYLVPVIATIACVIIKIDTLVWYQPVSMGIIIAGVVLSDISKRKVAKKIASRVAAGDVNVPRQD